MRGSSPIAARYFLPWLVGGIGSFGCFRENWQGIFDWLVAWTVDIDTLFFDS